MRRVRKTIELLQFDSNGSLETVFYFDKLKSYRLYDPSQTEAFLSLMSLVTHKANRPCSGELQEQKIGAVVNPGISRDRALGLLSEAFVALMASEDASKHNVSLVRDIKAFLERPLPSKVFGNE